MVLSLEIQSAKYKRSLMMSPGVGLRKSSNGLHTCTNAASLLVDSLSTLTCG
uniref:Uncharacterized protein n=1 Tax=Arundo donax TaxID=35708 RepID=A0A0A8Z212_ARUDO